ncbi:uncharacterized protein LOC126835312 [Adelges cooleyi]|uniref:uncharacterized protein LOC126835312 n=1 Tax=Adelges cooleyi TaxID=133065 RepID=UPI00217F76A6|nr:uncharacterized protein LOC126835312 [Adelges cooleyi]
MKSAQASRSVGMFMIITTGLPMVLCQYYSEHGGDGHHAEPQHDDHYVAPLYKYGYWVHDPKTKDIKNHWEHRDGDVVHGSYSLLQPDGHMRIVEYTADKHSGFNANVKYVYEGGSDKYGSSDQFDFGSNHLEEAPVVSHTAGLKQPMSKYYKKPRAEQPGFYKKSAPEPSGHYKKPANINVEHRSAKPSTGASPAGYKNQRLEHLQHAQQQPQQSVDYRPNPLEQFAKYQQANLDVPQQLAGFGYLDQGGSDHLESAQAPPPRRYNDQPTHHEATGIQHESSEPSRVQVNRPTQQTGNSYQSSEEKPSKLLRQLEAPHDFSDYSQEQETDEKDDIKIQKQPLREYHFEEPYPFENSANEGLKHQKRHSVESSSENTSNPAAKSSPVNSSPANSFPTSSSPAKSSEESPQLYDDYFYTYY